MKILLLLVILVFASLPAFAQDAAALFLTAPDDAVGAPAASRTGLIIERGATLVAFRLSDARRGEFKIVSQNSRELIVGIAVSNCDESSLRFFSIVNGKWIERTEKIIRRLGEKDVVAILAASPVTIEKREQQTSVAYFYEFSPDSTELRLVARKQDSCDRAGIVYEYEFKGRKYSIRKSSAE